MRTQFQYAELADEYVNMSIDRTDLTSWKRDHMMRAAIVYALLANFSPNGSSERAKKRD